MKYFKFLLFACLFLVISCKKTSVDGSNRKAFQSSVNDMATTLPTLKQIKFNEALYILKTFGVDAEGDIAEIEALGNLLNGKKIPEILSLADKVAQENNINWSSNAPPSLGEMNIFGDEKASEIDPNDIVANALNIIVRPALTDSVVGQKAIIVVPQLVDQNGNKVEFTNAGLETTLEVFSNGNKLSTSRNMMQNNDFKGFTVHFNSLPAEKIIDNQIEVKVSVKTTKKVYNFTKMGIEVNPSALKSATQPTTEEVDPTSIDPNSASSIDQNNQETITTKPPVVSDPKSTVNKFLSNLNSQNYKAAFDSSENPAWGSYDKFSNPNSGFGSVKNIAVKTISAPVTKDNTSTVNATYNVTDKNGNITALSVTYGLKSTSNGWKITSYKINNSQKQ